MFQLIFTLAFIVANVLEDFLISAIPFFFDIRHIISSGVLSLNVIRPYQCLLVDLISF